ncbi:TPA_asm: L [Mentha alphacytorhabdovirus 1]|nr:TPA_asm: L [Mentha alphacytorhabdovirus 1]
MDNYDDLEGSDEIKKVLKTILPDYHLRNPLKRNNWLDPKRRNIPMRQRRDRKYILDYYPSACFGMPWELNRIVTRMIPDVSLSQYEVSLSDLKFRLLIENTLVPLESEAPLSNIIDELSKINKVHWRQMRFWNYVLLVLNAISSNRKPPSGIVLDSNGVGSLQMREGRRLKILRTCVALISGKDCRVYDGDWIRMASDMGTQRFLICSALKIGRSMNEDHYPTEELLNRIFCWGDNVLEEIGNNGFKVIKAYEALVIGQLLSRGEGSLVQNDKFLKNTLRDLSEEGPQYYQKAKELIRIIEEIESIHHVSQVYGMHRVWGHPYVDSGKGMEKLMLIGRKNITTDSRLSVDAGRMFKFLFCKEYMRKHGRYPRIKRGVSLLETELEENDHNATGKGNHSLEAWDRVVFEHTYELPESFNLSMIIADKAISPTVSELISSIKLRHTVMDPDKRRGVKRWLEDTTLKPKEFLAEINEGIFDDDHKIIGLTPKERELNPTPRMFSLMAHKLRVYVVVTEQMLSDHILKMFPQITMTDSLLDLTKKTYATVKNQSSRVKRYNKKGFWASRVICASLDFEKWNGHMRKEMTSGVFTAIGNLFGLPELYNRTYDIFEQCYYYLADGSYVPRIDRGALKIEEPFSFTGHRGGMEGLRQKGWTIYTVCCLEVILSKYDCTYKIMGMGDNQVLQITLYTKKVDHRGQATEDGVSDMRRQIEEIFSDLVSSFTRSGLPLKPLETWMSEDLYLYGKVPMWRGVPLTMDVKKIMRTFPMSNDDIMTMENALGTISSNSTAATQVGPCIWTSFCVAVMMASLCVQDFMRYHPLLGENILSLVKDDPHWRLAMSKRDITSYPLTSDGLSLGMIRLLMQIIPKSIGGMGGINIYEMMMRGFPDNVSRDITYLDKVQRSELSPGWLKTVVRSWMVPVYMPHINYSTLLEDVTAINILSPRSPTSGVKQLVARYMSGGVKITNSEFKELMNSKHESVSSYLAECLCEAQEVHIRLLHDIYESTIFGYVDGILSKVVKTSTIQKLAINDSEGAVFNQIERDEVNFYKFFIWRCTWRDSVFEDMCPTERTKMIRREGWRKELRGVTTPFPAAYLVQGECHKRGTCECEDGYLSIHFPDGQLPNKMWDFDIGGNPPYLGSTTKEKVITGAGGKIYSGEPLVRRPINMLRTINWFVPPESNTAEVIKECVRAVTDLDPEPYQGVSEGTAGSEVHRYRDSSTTHGALTSSNFLYSTRYHISTDNFFRYSKGSDNTDVHYQAVFCYILELSNMMIFNKLRDKEVFPRFLHFKQSCYQCISKIPEDFVDLKTKKAIDAIPSKKENIYLFVKRDKIRVIEQISPLSSLAERSLSREGYMNMGSKEKTVWLQDVICDRIVSDILGSQSNDTFTTVGLLDVKSFERTMYLKLDPKYVIDRTVSQLRRCARWSARRFKTSSGKLSRSDIDRSYTNIVSLSGEHAFMGLGMFYCWQETASRINVYPEMVSPIGNPISIPAACSAMRKNILTLGLERKIRGLSRRMNVITEDEKHSHLVYKLILSEWGDGFFDCLDCISVLDKMNGKNLEWEIKHTVCSSGHRFCDRMKEYPWIKSSVTVERLRKDGSAADAPDRRIMIPDLSIRRPSSFVTQIMRSSEMRMRFTTMGLQDSGDNMVYQRDGRISKYSLLMVRMLPTNTWYKWSDIANRLSGLFSNEKVFCVGDGLGSSSVVIKGMGAKHVTTSTILEPDDAIPQTYVHNTSPMTCEYESGDIDDQSMIDRHNDVLSQGWRFSWQNKVNDHEVVVSDIEVIAESSSRERCEIMIRILNLKEWKLAVIKDYIFSPGEFATKVGIVHNSCVRWELVTSRLRSSVYPEVWWVLYHSKPGIGGLRSALSPDWRNMGGIYHRMLEELHNRYEEEEVTEEEAQAIATMTPPRSTEKMMTHLREWSTFPVVGCMLPNRGTYTQLFFYLKKSKRPQFVKSQRTSGRLKLYNSDYYKMRDRMFALCVSMIADLDSRQATLNDSEHWHIEWYEKSSGSWWARMIRGEEIDEPCSVLDYIPVLSLVMRKENLLFETIGTVVEFKQSRRDRSEVYFPISKTATLS